MKSRRRFWYRYYREQGYGPIMAWLRAKDAIKRHAT